MEQQLRERVVEATQVARHLSATNLAPPPEHPTGTPSERLAALRERVRAKARDDEKWRREQ